MQGAQCSRSGNDEGGPDQGGPDQGGHEPRFVLVETSHPGNIGSAARAIRTMGFGRLVLVRPASFPHADATALAAGADEVLAQAEVCDCLEAAVADCVRVYGTSARPRTLGWPHRDARAAAREACSVDTEPVAFVFGRERSGLTNAELDLCHAMLTIPTGSVYGSLNLAQAVQIVAYELRVALSDETAGGTDDVAGEELPVHAEMERFHAHLESTLVDIGFLDPANPRQLMRRLRRFFQRAQPTQIELNILRGILRNAGEPEPGSPAHARRRLPARQSGGKEGDMIEIRDDSHQQQD